MSSIFVSKNSGTPRLFLQDLGDGKWLDADGRIANFYEQGDNYVDTFTGEVYDIGWNPSLITVDAWYDPSDSSTLTLDSGNVTDLADKANSYDMAQTSAQFQPTTTTLNGNSALHLSGGFLLNDTLGTVFSGDEVPVYFYAVFQPYEQAEEAAMIAMDSPSNAFPVISFGIGSSGTNWKQERRDDAGIGTAFDTVASDDNAHVLSYFFEGVSPYAFKSWLDGNVNYNQFSAALVGDVTVPRVGLGRRINGGNAWHGKLGEVIFTSTYSESERQKIEGYLAHRWGLVAKLPASHPYKTFAPLYPL